MTDYIELPINEKEVEKFSDKLLHLVKGSGLKEHEMIHALMDAACNICILIDNPVWKSFLNEALDASIERFDY